MNSAPVRGRLAWAAAVALVAIGPASARSLLVGSAVSLREPLTEIASRFEALPGAPAVSLTFGASSAVARQIRAGAAIDVFASADPRLLDDLAERGLMDGSPVRLAGNRLVVVATPSLAGTIRTPRDLLDPRIERIAVPEAAVPVGRYARRWLRDRSLLEPLAARLLPTEHARATLAAVDGDHADVAIVYATDARIARHAVVVLTIPDSEQPEIVYTAALVRSDRSPEPARAFLDFLSSDVARSVLREAGFAVDLPERAPAP